MARKKADDNKVVVGNILNVSGEVTIAGGDIYEGFTSEQVSVLITQITTTFEPKKFDGRSPYKGLDVFEEEDAELFFGREKLVDDLVSRVKDSRTVFVTGPSGSGKSSLVRAGLIHALKQGAIKNSERWLYATMKPGRDPTGELGRVASGLAGSTNAEDEIRAKVIGDATIFARWCEIALKEGRDKRAVLFIDQFEEVFTQINSENERVAFLNLLTHAATIENGRLIILFSMRSDFVSNCATYPQINSLLNQQFIQIGAMQPEELVSAIAQPALRVGLRIDPDLIAQIINEMKGEPGALPLMQFALKDLFDSQGEKSGVIALTLNDYLQRGGIHKALEQHADDSFSKLSKNEQELARSIFSGLIEIGRGTEDTRRTALFDELLPSDIKAADVEAVIQKLADARLITTDEQAGKDTVTISHEKLIDAWPWLKKLVNENREVIALQNEIASDAQEWDDHKRDPSYLYTGVRLANAREQVGTKKFLLSGLAQLFIDMGVRAYTNELILEKHRTVALRRQRLFLVNAMVLVVIAIFFVIFSRNQAQEERQIAQAASTLAVAQQSTAQANAEAAQMQAKIARAGELTTYSDSLRESKFDLSLLFSVEAFIMADTPRTQRILLANTQNKPQMLQYLHGHSNPVVGMAISPESKTLASVSNDGALILWDIASHQLISKSFIEDTDLVKLIAFSPDRRILAFVQEGKTFVSLWDVESAKQIGQPLEGQTHDISSITFSHDGKILASGSFRFNNQSIGQGTIILWDVGTGQPLGLPIITENGKIESLGFSPDGKYLATGATNGYVQIWEIATGKEIIRLEVRDLITSVTFSPDGKYIVSSGISNHTVRVWEVTTGQEIARIAEDEGISTITFSPDGKTLALGSCIKLIGGDCIQGEITLLETSFWQPISEPLIGHISVVTNLIFSPDGKTLVSGSYDGTIILWTMEVHQPIANTLPHLEGFVNNLSFSPDGKTLAAGICTQGSSPDFCVEGETILWQTVLYVPIGQTLPGYHVSFGPDNKIITTGNTDNIILRDATSMQPIGPPLPGYLGEFSPDGKTIASSTNNVITLLDITTGQQIGRPFPGDLFAFSPDGKIIASASSHDNTITLWNINSGLPPRKLVTEDYHSISDLAFSPDDKTLASVYENKTIILWDISTGQPAGEPLAYNSEVYKLFNSETFSIAFSPDSKILASGGTTVIDGFVSDTISMWDVKTHQPVLDQPLRMFGSFGEGPVRITSLAFSPDGLKLASGNEYGFLTILDLETQFWIEINCQRAGRNFTRAEWARYFPDEEYRATCPQWSLEPEPALAPTPTPILSSIDVSTSKIDINTASREELDTLPDIGPTLAQRIIDYREQNGFFKAIEDIMLINGIGPATFETVKNLITVSSSESEATPTPGPTSTP